MVINNQSKPKFSIVIANYNGRRFLEKCLDSIQNSRLKPERIIVVDDASTDNSGAIVKEKFPNVILIENKNNLGPTKSRNIGAQQAIGKEIYYFLR
ncbi:MAG: glycosyltransferase [Nitrospiraceae bacterium]|nr:glycosyltransferase [Nitrospiraceae bacterium]